MNKFAKSLAAIFLLTVTTLAAAKPDDDLAITMTQSRVVMQDGKEATEPAEAAKPGDVIEYAAEYRNKSTKSLGAVMAIIPIPLGTEYLPDTAKPNVAFASLKGDKYEAVPLKRKVKQADGKEVEQLVPYSEYRFVRWSVGDMAPGKSQKYSLRVKLENNSAAVGGNKDK
ncbi:MAG: hypothetical protein RL020_1308 [Pseudomonadota bacterium]